MSRFRFVSAKALPQSSMIARHPSTPWISGMTGQFGAKAELGMAYHPSWSGIELATGALLVPWDEPWIPRARIATRVRKQRSTVLTLELARRVGECGGIRHECRKR